MVIASAFAEAGLTDQATVNRLQRSADVAELVQQAKAALRTYQKTGMQAAFAKYMRLKRRLPRKVANSI